MEIKIPLFSVFTYILNFFGSVKATRLDGQKELFLATILGNVDKVGVLLHSGRAQVNGWTDNATRWTALHWAAKLGRAEVAQLLLENGANVSAKANYIGEKGAAPVLTPLLLAAQRSLPIVKMLLATGASINERGKYLDTPLHAAIAASQLEIVEYLLERGANASALANYNTDPEGTPPTVTPLHFAAKTGNTAILALLLNRTDVAVDARDSSGMTPLFQAITSGNVASVELLLEKGANASARGRLFNTSIVVPMHIVSLYANGNVPMARALLKFGADVNATLWPMGLTTLHLAAKMDQPALIEFLLASGAALSSSCAEVFGADDGPGEGPAVLPPCCWSPLMLAVQMGSVRAVEVLLSKGADINERGKFGTTPLHMAIDYGQLAVVKLLLLHGANTSIGSHFTNEPVGVGPKRTPLFAAVAQRNAAILRALLEWCCPRLDTEAREAMGMTPLFHAIAWRHLANVELLLESGANANARAIGLARDPPGHPSAPVPLHIVPVFANGSVPMARALLKFGADVNAASPNGFTTLHYAAQRNQADLILLLLSNGADPSLKALPIGLSPSTVPAYLTPLLVAADAHSINAIAALLTDDRSGNLSDVFLNSQFPQSVQKLAFDNINANAMVAHNWIPQYGIRIVGLVGNLVTFCTILATSALRKNLVNQYVLALLCSDSLILLFYFSAALLDHINYGICVLDQYLHNVAICTSNLVVTLLSLERFFAILFPMVHLRYKHFGRWKIILGAVTFALVFSLNMFASVYPADIWLIDKCTFNFFDPLSRYLYVFPKMAVTFLLPLLTAIVVNLCIIKKVRTKSFIRGENSHNQNGSTGKGKLNAKLLFLIPVVFVVLNTPYNLTQAYPMLVLPSTSLQAFITLNLVAFYLYTANFASNFFLYAVASRKFRQALYQIWIGRLLFFSNRCRSRGDRS